MTIRQMCPADFDRVMEMMEVFYASDALLIHPGRDVLRRTLSDCVGDCPFLEGFVFESEGQTAGYAMTALSYSTEAGGLCVWVEDLYLRPQFRGQGAGSDFLAMLRQHYRGRAARLRLEAEPDNQKAIGVYRRAGFEILGYTQLIQDLNGERTGEACFQADF